ncbi:2309_t:CDS:2 [Acaulospora colombiana]|uniref:2309_t:CDS:1 n=1 Tax=Acaulospora colombiana TaxID=27376 RepID=A0ACA9Q1G6_9GLOM|nr:2309_t:CDS:2 [Acaulospora colombiana]
MATNEKPAENKPNVKGPQTTAKRIQVPRPNKISRPEVDGINRTAEGFLQLYYDLMDGSQRDARITLLYRDTSLMIWNGETITGVEKIKEFLAKMPESKHEIQSWDCHPIPGSATTTSPPILITVSGTVLHGTMPTKIPQTKKPGVLPRVFSQTFVLAHDPASQPPATTSDQPASNEVYYVRSDTLRFVG